MRSDEYNYKYCGISIVIRNSNGVVRHRTKRLKEIKGFPNDQIKSDLETFIDNYRSESLTGLQLDPKVSKGLMQIPLAFGQEIVNKLESYAKKWQQPAYVKFGTTGMISEGKPGQPNYQIESDDEKQKLAFYYSHKEFDAHEFDYKNITSRLSLPDIKRIWLID